VSEKFGCNSVDKNVDGLNVFRVLSRWKWGYTLGDY
jgi:hypothetical protein